MQALIIYCPPAGHSETMQPDDRFTVMVNALQLGGVQADCFPVGSDQQLIRRLEQERPDLVFSAAYYTTGPSRQNVHTLLERLGYPYIGSDAKALELVIAKAGLKKQWQRCGVQTPAYVNVRKLEPGCPEPLEKLYSLSDFPYIVKPAKEGNSRGIDENCIVFDRTALVHQTAQKLSLFGEVLVERYLGNAEDIREFTVAMIGSPSGGLILPAEVRLRHPRKRRVITTQDKEEHNTIAVPVPHSPLRTMISSFARKAFQAAGVRDYARCDVLFAEGKLYALEINGQPMVPDLWFGACARGAGLETHQYLNAIFLSGITRLIREGHELEIPKAMVDILPKEVSQGLSHYRNEWLDYRQLIGSHHE